MSFYDLKSYDIIRSVNLWRRWRVWRWKHVIPEDEVESPHDEEDDCKAERDPDGHPQPRGDPVNFRYLAVNVVVLLRTCRGRCKGRQAVT